MIMRPAKSIAYRANCEIPPPFFVLLSTTNVYFWLSLAGVEQDGVRPTS